MAAPAAGALLARFAGPGVIVWGHRSRWIVAGLLPVAVGLGGYTLASWAGVITAHPDIVTTAAIISAVVSIPIACLTAIGEEIGWRGFLWPLCRRRLTFIPATLIVTSVWWLYHVPLVLLGWYGFLGGLPAFTVAILGFSAFVGVLTDRSHGIWASVVAHGGWNSLVATSFAVKGVGASTHGFTGSHAMVGEFGWIAALSMLALGAAAVVWHLATGGAHRYSPTLGSEPRPRHRRAMRHREEHPRAGAPAGHDRRWGHVV